MTRKQNEKWLKRHGFTDGRWRSEQHDQRKERERRDDPEERRVRKVELWRGYEDADSE